MMTTRMSSMGAVVAVVCLVVAAGPAPPEQRPLDSRPVVALIREGRDHSDRGDFPKAFRAFQAAIDQATGAEVAMKSVLGSVATLIRSPLGELKAEAALSAAGLIRAWDGKDAPDPKRVPDYYRIATESGSPRQQAIAQLNLAAIAMERAVNDQATSGADDAGAIGQASGRWSADLAEAEAALAQAARFAAADRIFSAAGGILVLAAGGPLGVADEFRPYDFLLEYNSGYLARLRACPDGGFVRDRKAAGVAYARFRAALELEPSFEPAAHEAFLLLYRGGYATDAPLRARELGIWLVDRGQGDLAMRHILGGLKFWRDWSEGRTLLTVLVRYDAARRVTPKDLDLPLVAHRWREDAPYLKDVNELVRRIRPADPPQIPGHPAFRPEVLDEPATQLDLLRTLKGNEHFRPLWPRVEAICRVFGVDGGPPASDPSSREPFGEWEYDDVDRLQFARFLMTQGDYLYAPLDDFSKPRDVGRAYTLYTAAWTLAPEDPQAALSVVCAVHDYPDELRFGPKDYRDLFDRLYRRDLGGGRRYVPRASTTGEAARDNSKMIDLLMLELHQSFKQDPWPEGLFDARLLPDMAPKGGDPGRRAPIGRAPLPAGSREYPERYARQADIYENQILPFPPDIREQRLLAVEGFLDRREAAPARIQLEAAERIKWPLSRAERQRLERARTRLADLVTRRKSKGGAAGTQSQALPPALPRTPPLPSKNP